MTKAVTEAGFDAGTSLGAPAHICDSNWVVLKFGGTSVATAENWQTIAGLVQNRLQAGLRPLIVHSALAGVSNALEEILQTASAGRPADGLGKIRDQHYALASAVGLDGPALVDDTLHELEQLVAGVRLVREVGVRVRVRVMALGEIMATRLGAEFLKSCGLSVRWLDAREVLQSVTAGGGQRRQDALLSQGAIAGGGQRRQDYLAAVCDSAADPALAEELGRSHDVVLTQGFIASNAWGETVLLGRGGSDTSAAYFTARLQARRLEIWTDVPGMFTANPRVVPSARLLLALQYNEAQELASAGSSVLHPRCLSPLKGHGIPLFIRCTTAPDIAGTVIAAATDEPEPRVKGICLRNGITLISMDGIGMWHEVGFLAQAFAVFNEHRVSVDLVSTSETNVTVSIDTADGMLADDVERDLLADLGQLCRVRAIHDCSAISLVGRKIRTILPRLAPALQVFEEEKIHLMSQAANDLNLSFVVEQGQGPRLVRKLHASIIGKAAGGVAFGPSWEQLFHAREAAVHAHDAWWIHKRDELLEIAADHDSAYVYDLGTVRKRAQSLLGLDSVSRVLYAVKANFNAEILKLLAGQGVDFECVSPGEVEHLEAVLPGLDTGRILFTPNFAGRSEYAWALDKGLQLTLDNLYPLKAWPELFAGSRLFIRIDPGQGRGHHEHVKTAGVHSKFGIPQFELGELRQLLAAAGATVIGIHAHSGSGILDPDNWRAVAAELVQVAHDFPEVSAIDLGGGLGVPEKPGEQAFDLDKLDAMLAEMRAANPQYELWLEPGRYLVAEAGVLVTRVTQLKGKGEMRYVGVDTGMNSLIRPALYGAYHEIVNLSRAGEVPTEIVTVVGPICETGDRLGSDRLLPQTREGDVMLIANAGAYGYVMSSRYNLRPVAAEAVIPLTGTDGN